jgi:hypothetical protein
MQSSFVGFVDESGDEGFTFLPEHGGSSRWFVLSAAVFRKAGESGAIECVRAVRAALGKPPTKALHFADLKHDARVLYCQHLAGLPMRTVSILVCKEMLAEPERYQSSPFMLYRYATRLLLERVSWLCRDNRKGDDGDGSIQLVFSDRSAMSYDDLRAYLLKLRDMSKAQDIRIDWDVVTPEGVRSVAHSQLAGLQVADAVASSYFQAVNCGRLGVAEPRYSRILLKLAYRHNRTAVSGYGLKWWPSFEECRKKMPHIAALEG